MASPPSFDEIKAVVRGEVISATNTYMLLVELAVPLKNQPLLREHYPFIVDSLADALSGQVLMTVCRLFDPDEDPRHASLSTFLRRVSQDHAADQGVPRGLVGRRRAFEASIPGFLDEIRGRWKTLVVHRSAYLAHRDVSKRQLPPITYADVRAAFEWAQRVLAAYFTAYEDATQLFEIGGLKHDPPRFLEWCRLDDYKRHFDEHMKRRHDQALKDMGLGPKE